MGLAASQARLLLLTAKNDALELSAQKIEQERLMLAQEQETIAQEYSDATSNTIYTCRVVDENGETQQVSMGLDSLAKSQAGSAGTGASIIIADANGKPVVKATASRVATDDTNLGSWQMDYQVEVDGEMVDIDDLKGTNDTLYKYYKNVIESLNSNGSNSPLQYGIGSGGFQLWVQDTSDTANVDSTDQIVSDTKVSDSGKVSVNDDFYVRKAPESLSGVTSRYYTEDDAAAQAKYNTAMAKVNALDTRLENKLNQVETQKKAVEQEMESVDSIVQSNIERTFQYFS